MLHSHIKEFNQKKKIAETGGSKAFPVSGYQFPVSVIQHRTLDTEHRKPDALIFPPSPLKKPK